MECIDDYVWYQEGPGVRKNQYTIDGVKLLNVANLVDGKIDLSTSKRCISVDEASGKYKHFLVDEGDLIIASSGIQVDYFDKKMGFATKEHLPLCMNTSTIRFKVKNEKATNINYFMWFLKSSKFKIQLQKLITGSAQLNFGPSHLKKIKIKMPSIAEQDEIVKKLEKVQNIIDIRKKQLEELDELIKSQFVEMFGNPIINEKGWEKKRLADECNIITGNTPSRNKKEYYGDYIEWIKSDNINTPSNYITKAEEYLSKEGLKIGRSIKEDSILMTCIAGSISCIGNVAMTDRKVCFNQQINGIETLNNNTLFMYIQFILSKQYIQSTINMSLKGILSKGKLSELEFVFPPIELQNQFAEIVKQIDKQKFEIQKSLDEMQKIQKSLMNKYFE
ncbi:MAG: restriction endonuclease subunit S [Clostridia bacterium]|nr:restriction endonuclease subunit S [Clostridia bacterium]